MPIRIISVRVSGALVYVVILTFNKRIHWHTTGSFRWLVTDTTASACVTQYRLLRDYCY